MRCIISAILTPLLLLRLSVRNFFYLIVLTIILLSCSSSKVTKETKIEQYRVDIEKYSPLDEYFTSHQNYSELKEAQVWFNYESDVSSPKPRYTQKEAKVFKIQVQISDDFNSIKENKNKISQLFPDKTITINFDQPFYKLRIGNFISRKEATEFLKALESNGYIGCRIIEESN